LIASSPITPRLEALGAMAAEVALGGLLFPALLTVFVLGIFTPYLAGWGGRDLDQFGGNDMTWRSWLTFLLIAAAVSGARLLITGDGPLHGALERRAASLGARVQFLGTVSRDEMRARFQTSDLVMVPSVTISGTQENTSIAALEAMACGTPVIATRIGGLPEVIEDGRTGVLVPERDAESLAAAAVLLLRDPGRLGEMRSACRDHVVQRFSVGGWASKVLEVYAETLEANGHPGTRGAG